MTVKIKGLCYHAWPPKTSENLNEDLKIHLRGFVFFFFETGSQASLKHMEILLSQALSTGITEWRTTMSGKKVLGPQPKDQKFRQVYRVIS